MNSFRTHSRGVALLSLLAAGSLQASVFTVTTTADSGPGSFRQALLNANLNLGTDTIRFQIPGTGPFTIIPASTLPAITDPVIIDGTSQFNYAGKPLIEMDGALLPPQTDGLLILAGSSTVEGLAINRCPRDAIRLQGLGGNVVQGNFLGTDVTGTVAAANGEGGVMIMGSAGNLVGGATAAARNVISGGNQNGIYIYTAGAVNNVVTGNYIGTDVTGTVALGNFYNGLEIATCSSNVIGPNNVISGNGESGVYFLSGPTLGNTVTGNYIGVSAGGGVALANVADGVTLNGASYTAITSNVLSGNGNTGVNLWTSNSTGNVVSGNYIGTDATGKAALPNQTNGVTINASSGNTLGNNIISGNKQFGVFVYSTSASNAFSGNYIGSTITGTNALPNALGGVALQGGAYNVVGPNNLISGNTGNGVFVATAGASNNVITGNLIGLNKTGEKALANTAAGVYVQTPGNTIGGIGAGTGNIISGNSQNGIFVFGASNNLIEGNFIGTDVLGKTGLPNVYSGIALSNAPANVIGGSNNMARNLISGNSVSGISLGGFTAGTVVQGNYIGTDTTGTRAVGNAGGGIYYGAGSNLIGGSAVGEGNLVSGNSQEGISVGNPGANGNVIQGNFIGTQADGMSLLGNQWHNIDLLNTASNNIIGGTNYFAANHIGYALTSQYDGIRVRAGCLGNTIAGNSIFSNTGWGIVINNSGVTITNLVTITAATSTTTNLAYTGPTTSPNGGAPGTGAPFTPMPSNTTIIQAAMSTYANGRFYVQFYRNTVASASGYGEGITYLGATNITTGGNGQTSFTVTLPVAVTTGSYLTATATDAAGTTWEFGPDFKVLNGTSPRAIGNDQTTPNTAPAISMTANGGNNGGTLSLSWPADLSLQQTTNLSDPASWTMVTEGITVANGSNILTSQPASPMMFYRLCSTNAGNRTGE